MNTPQLIVNGLTVGSVIALVAVGLTLIYGILKLSNFAQGDLMTLGGYFTWVINSQGINIWISMALGAMGTIAMMLLTEFILWKPMRDRKAEPTTLIIISIGLALFLRSGILLIWGSKNQRYKLPVVPALDLAGVKVASNSLLVMGLTILVFVALYFLLQKTKTGKAMRAVADNLDLARVSGINVERVVIWTWVISGALTALAGSFYGLITVLRPNMGWFLILPMFAASILGGVGNPYGAIAGGLIIGIAQEVSIPWLGSEYKLGVALFLMVAILLLRPNGLFRGLG